MLNRRITNAIRFLMDECLPPIVRDSRLFMYPFYRLAYRGGNIDQIMNFKREVYGWDRQQYNSFYRNLDSLSRHRDTDLNEACVERIVDSIPEHAQSVLDIGCGSGYLLRRVASARPGLKVVGSDVADAGSGPRPYDLVLSDVCRLPFADGTFDFVTCCHTLEHVVDLPGAMIELKRVTRGRLLIVLPKQRYYYYTLDEHVNFFPQKEPLLHSLRLPEASCTNVGGDWLLLTDIRQRATN